MYGRKYSVRSTSAALSRENRCSVQRPDRARRSQAGMPSVWANENGRTHSEKWLESRKVSTFAAPAGPGTRVTPHEGRAQRPGRSLSYSSPQTGHRKRVSTLDMGSVSLHSEKKVGPAGSNALTWPACLQSQDRERAGPVRPGTVFLNAFPRAAVTVDHIEVARGTRKSGDLEKKAKKLVGFGLESCIRLSAVALRLIGNGVSVTGL